MELQDYWIQTKELTLASVKSRYRKTWAGFLWVIMNPIIMFGVQGIVFRKFLKMDMPDYFLFLLGGLLPWIFLTQTVQMGTPVFVIQAQLLRSFKINPWVVLGAQVLDSFFNFLVTFLLVLLPLYIWSDKSIITLLLLPIALIPLLVGALTVTITLSILNVFYRDINFVMGFIFSVLFFLTPIFYPREYIPADYQWLVDFNPFFYFIIPFRVLLYTNDVVALFPVFVKSVGVCLICTGLAFFVWKKKQNEFYRRL